MLRIHTDNFVPKYVNGTWLWDDNQKNLHFDKRAVAVKEHIILTNGFKFLGTINQVEEMIFRQEFQRPDTTHDADVILIQDIKNLVMFLAPTQIITKDFIQFVNTRTVDALIKSLIMYFEYFLKLVEFILIRRDEVSGEKAQIQSEQSTEIKRILSSHLSQYRLLVARAYSNIVLGQDEMSRYYHIKPIVNISQSIRDKAFHEGFLAFCTQVIWIAMHRRNYDIIDMEMNRLFRSEHFKLPRYEAIQYSKVEASMLYGKNYKRCNYRAQNSPLIQEISNVDNPNLPILWIGERKYRGTDLRIAQLELEYIVPDSQLNLIDVVHGILGHPKRLYNTLLKIDWEAVRYQDYSADYDPYRIVTQPYLEIPALDEEKLRQNCQTFESYYQLKTLREGWTKGMIEKWMRRNEILKYFKTEGMITDIWVKCDREVKDTSYGPSVDEIIKKFIARKEKLRKK